MVKKNKKRLLIYAHYYIPDTAATGQILKELAEGLKEIFDITVICVVPSYLGTVEEKYKTQRYYVEEDDGVKILRIRVPEFSKANRRSRIKNIMSYFWGAMRATFKVGKMDYVLSISQPPILGGLLGVWGKWIKKAKFIYNIQDFNPEQIMVVDYSKNKLIIKILMFLDKFSCKRSNLIITVGRDLVETVHKRFIKGKMPKTVMVNNWIDEDMVYPVESSHSKVMKFKAEYGLENKFVFMYSGNIGLYYDLENIFKIIEKFKEGTKTAAGREVVFAFVGAGSVLEKLVKYKEQHRMDNVIFIPYQDKGNLVYSLNAGDVHWCINAKGIKGVSCPSKYYGVAACAKPVLGVLESGSEIRCIIEDTNGGICSEPGEYKVLEQNIRRYIEEIDNDKLVAMGENSRNNLLKNLTKKISVKKYAEEILKC